MKHVFGNILVKRGEKHASVSSEVAVTTTPETKGKRQWEQWSVEDKDSFFEGLCEVGLKYWNGILFQRQDVL